MNAIIALIFVGIILPPLVKRLGSRLLMLAASVGLCAANILNSIAPNVPFLFFSLGILTGQCSFNTVKFANLSDSAFFWLLGDHS